MFSAKDRRYQSQALRGMPVAEGMHSLDNLVEGKSVTLYLGVISTVFISAAQAILGCNLFVLLVAASSAILVTILLAAAPTRLGSWFTAVVFFQLFGVAWIYKTLILVPFDDGLLQPTLSMFLGLLAVTIAASVAVSNRVLRPSANLLDRFYGDSRTWAISGLLLFGLGEMATYASYLINVVGASNFGGFGPLTKCAIAGEALLINASLRRGRVMDWKIALIFIVGFANALLFNSKSGIIFPIACYILAILVSPLPRAKIVKALLMLVPCLIFANSVAFPDIHVLRSTDFRNVPLAERMQLIEGVLSTHHSWQEVRVDSGDISEEYQLFVRTDNWVVRRFASLGYLDITLEFGDPSVSHIPFSVFIRDCMNKALPAGLATDKDSISLADKLWHIIDPRMSVGGNTTMGSIGTSRLVFGEWRGIAVLAAVWLCFLWLYQWGYGNDIRRPLVQFILIASIPELIETDIQYLFVCLLRLFWQDLAIMALVGWMVRFVVVRTKGLWSH